MNEVVTNELCSYASTLNALLPSLSYFSFLSRVPPLFTFLLARRCAFLKRAVVTIRDIVRASSTRRSWLSLARTSEREPTENGQSKVSEGILSFTMGDKLLSVQRCLNADLPFPRPMVDGNSRYSGRILQF